MALDDRRHDQFMDTHSAAADEASLPGPEEPPARSRRQRLRLPLIAGGVVAAVVAGGALYLHGGRYESTDNAYIQSGMVAVTANVSGPVIAVHVRDNQRVKAGQPLFEIEPAPYETAVAEAEAALADARTRIVALQANYRQGAAELQSAAARLDYARRESERQQRLLAEGISSQNQYDQATLAASNAVAGIEAARQQMASVRAALSGNVDGPIDAQPQVKRAAAALRRAQLDLGYTRVVAPIDGTVTKVSQLQVGDYVQASRPVFTLVGTHLWVEANFKESQLDHMRVGQKATFEVDAFPDLELHGHVRSFSPGTGNSFALLPAENATGNWVKVVQRLPVELEIDNAPADVPLHAGLSVNATVDTGYRRHLFGSAGAAAPAR